MKRLILLLFILVSVNIAFAQSYEEKIVNPFTKIIKLPDGRYIAEIYSRQKFVPFDGGFTYFTNATTVEYDNGLIQIIYDNNRVMLETIVVIDNKRYTIPQLKEAFPFVSVNFVLYDRRDYYEYAMNLSGFRNKLPQYIIFKLKDQTMPITGMLTLFNMGEYSLVLTWEPPFIRFVRKGYEKINENKVKVGNLILNYEDVNRSGLNVEIKGREIIIGKIYSDYIDPIIEFAAENITYDGYLNRSTRIISNNFIKVGNETQETRGFIDFNISSIPDDVTIDSINLSVNIAENNLAGDFIFLRSLPQRAEDYSNDNSGNQQLFDNISSGSSYAEYQTSLIGEINIPLNYNATSDMQNKLTEDWFSIGIMTNETANSYFTFNSSETEDAPKLTVVFHEGIEIASCMELNESGKTYILTSNVTSNSTCFTINNYSITLDCQGYTINFSANGTSNSYGVTSNQNNTVIRNCNIIEGKSASGNYGIKFDNVYNGIIENNTINVIGNTGGGIQTSSNGYNLTVKYNTISVNSTYASPLNLYCSGSKIIGNIFKSYASGGRGIVIPGASNSLFSNNTIIMYNSGEAIFMPLSPMNNIFINTTINLTSSGGKGVSIIGSVDNTTFRYLRIYKNDPDVRGISLELNANITIEDSVLNDGTYPQGGNDTYFDSNSAGNINFTNVSYSTFYFDSTSTAKLIQKWWLDVYVNDSYGQPIENANVKLTDNSGNVIFADTTPANGHIRKAVIESKINATETINYNNHTINVTKQNYYPYIKDLNITNNTLLLVMLQPEKAISASCSGSSPSEFDNWTITTDTECESGIIELGTDTILNISSEKTLTLRNVELRLDSSSDGRAGIYIYGRLILNNSNITRHPLGNKRFAFISYSGSSINISNAKMEYIGWSDNFGEKGLEINGTLYADSLTVNNSHYGLVLYSSNNTVKNSKISSERIDVESNGYNNTFLNTTYQNESVGGSLVRKWYVEVHVKSDGNPLSGATVYAKRGETIYTSGTTDDSGSLVFELPQYENSSGSTEFYMFNITAIKTNYQISSNEVSVTNNLIGPNAVTIELQPIQTGGGSGSWSGITTKKKIYNFTVSDEIINQKLKAGSASSTEIKIENTGNSQITLNISLEGEISKFISVEKFLTLDAGEIKNLKLNFYSIDENLTGTYTGKLIISFNNIKREVFIILNVNPKQALLDTIVKIKNENKLVAPGEDLKLTTTLINLGEAGRVDVTILYEIRDMEGNTIYTSHETRALETQMDIYNEISLPDNIEEGNYILYVKATYSNVTVSGSDVFYVRKRASILQFIMVIISTIVVIASLAMLFKSRKVKR